MPNERDTSNLYRFEMMKSRVNTILSKHSTFEIAFLKTFYRINI